MDIMFISRRGSMYEYFLFLSAHSNFNTCVYDFSLRPYFRSTISELASVEVSKGIAFQLQRKKVKYRLPDWLWFLIERYYRFKFHYLFRRFSWLIEHHSPKCIAIFNGNRLPEQVIKNIAKKSYIPVIHFENGLLPNTTTFDLLGVNNSNSLPRSAAFYANYKAIGMDDTIVETTLVQRSFHRLKRNYVQHPNFHLQLPKKFIFVPLQVLFDSQVLLNSPNIKTMRELYDWIEFSTLNCTDESLHFVVKEHPSDPHRYTDLYNRHSRIMFSNKTTQELIEKSDAVVTLNSSVGIESLCLGKRVFVLGASCYAIKGITTPIASKEELSQQINGLENWQLDLSLVNKFIAYVKDVYCVPISWRMPNQVHLDNLDKRFKRLLSSQAPSVDNSINHLKTGKPV
jgi:capsular polysaccharide export protein|tara:strand:- start:1218 stop:2414 length:1197 start_codon:yes stop_codon:yes gene_type:complete